MKVHELIELLEDQDPRDDVRLLDQHGLEWEIEDVDNIDHNVVNINIVEVS